MIERDTIKTLIANSQDTRKNFWTAFIVLTGAIGALLMNIDTTIKLVLFVISSIAEISLVYFIMNVNNDISKNLNMLIKLDKEE